jgi:hypothetical protein
MDFTMLKQLARRGRFDAIIHDKEFTEPAMLQLAKILHHDNPGLNISLDGVDVANILADAPHLHPDEYNMLLHYLQTTAQQPWWQHYKAMPHSNPAHVLPFCAQQPTQLTLEGKRTYSCQRSHEGNSSIQFYNPHTAQAPCTGFIQKIWQIPLQGVMQTFILVSPHQNLPSSEEQKAPYSQLPHLYTKVVAAQPSDKLLIIEPKDIITHLTFYKCPKGTFQINQDILVICWALNRSRK